MGPSWDARVYLNDQYITAVKIKNSNSLRSSEE